MKQSQASTVYYKRSRFSTRLPVGRRYTASHFWLLEEQTGVWRIGFTKFAMRMMGDLVEYSFAVAPRDRVEVGQTIGSIEGLKAVTDLYCIVSGEFLGGNSELERDVTLADSQPYDAGWIYRAQGTPDPGNFDVQGYVAVLDATIDKMLSDRHKGADESDEG